MSTLMFFLKNLRHRASYIPEGALVLSALTFVSYILGFLRDRLFARTFGLSSELDAYNAAFVLPELLLDIFVAGGLAAAFIPVFSKAATRDTKRAELFSRTTITASVLVMALSSTLVFIFADATVPMIAPGFDATTRELYIRLLRLMCIPPVIFAASITLGEILVAKRRFVYFGMAPVLYNLGILAGTALLAPSWGIRGVVAGTIGGALMHAGIRIAGMWKERSVFRPALAFSIPEFKEFILLMLPKMIGHPIEPITFLFFTAVASTTGEGAISAVSFGRNFQSVPVALIGIAFSIAVFPALAEAFAENDRANYMLRFKKALVGILALSIPAAIALYIFGPFIVTFFFAGGAFTAENMRTTSYILMLFSLSVPLESLSHILSRALYAQRNTLLPVISSLGGLLICITAARILSPTLELAAIPVAFAAGNGVKVTLLGIFLRARISR